MTGQTPASTLLAAADRIRDLAAAATKPRKPEFGWGFLDEDEVQPGYPGTDIVCSQAGGTELVAQKVHWEDARWIAALSPAIAPMIEKWLREAAGDFDAYGEYWVDMPEDVRNALAFAKAILDTP